MILALSVVVVINIFLRKMFSFSLQGVDEYGGYCLALAASIGFSQAAFDRAHIRIDVVTSHFPLRLRAVFDVLALLALNATGWFIALQGFGVLQASFVVGAQATSVLRTPLAYPQGLWVAALLWFCLVLSIQVLRAVVTLLLADWTGIVDNFGVPDVDQEVRQEIEAARRRVGKKLGLPGARLTRAAQEHVGSIAFLSRECTSQRDLPHRVRQRRHDDRRPAEHGGEHRLEHDDRIPADRDPPVHPARRAAYPKRRRGPDVRRGGSVGPATARGTAAFDIITCAMFAATSGSSVATAATIGTVALPTFKKLGYDEPLVLGSIAAGGTLGILIPPSITMIVYGALTNVSVGKLFAAGIIPGIILAMLMSGVIVVLALAGKVTQKSEHVFIPILQRIRKLVDVLPVMFIFTSSWAASIWATLRRPKPRRWAWSARSASRR